MRSLYAAAVDPAHTLSDEDLDASLAATIARKPAHSEWWVFAYGSLLWNPLFPFDDAVPATAAGLHRRFCLWSRASRGTAEAPGLVLGLVPGGSCRGVAYRLPADAARDELWLLWRREMVLGSYHPRWITVRASPRAHGRHAARPLVALAFVVDRKHRQYTGALSSEAEIDVLASASGAFGSSADYLERARVALITHGIVDPYLERLAEGVNARHAMASPMPGGLAPEQ